MLPTDFIYWRSRLLEVAHTFKGRLQIVMSDEVEYVEELGDLGVKDHADDLVIALWVGKKEKYIMSDDFDEDSVNTFIEVSWQKCTIVISCMFCSCTLMEGYVQSYNHNANHNKKGQ